MLNLILRIGAGLCFIGHGAFGIITKAAWVPYFGVVGIPETWAYRLMPLVGTIDIAVGLIVLFSPRRLPIGYMAIWGFWTALLRPLTGESVFEVIERAGNYGVPLALLLLVGFPRDLRSCFTLATPQPLTPDRERLIMRVLQASTVLLVGGHGALGAVTGKGIFAVHYASVGLPTGLTAVIGGLEIALAVAIALRPSGPLLVGASLWKLATESLWLTSGSPVWEFVERAGSYTAPLALAMMMVAVAKRAESGHRPGARLTA